MLNPTTIGYASAACGYFVLVGMLVANFQRDPLWYRMIAAAGLSVFWAAAAALTATQHALALPAFAALEVARDAGWLLLMTGVFAALLPRRLIRTIPLACVVLLLLLTIPGMDVGRQLSHDGLLFGFIGIVLVEQIYRNAEAERQPWLLCLLSVTGGQCLYDLILYGEAEVFGAVDPVSFAMRAFFMVISLPVLVVAVSKRPRTDRSILISREVVFYTSAFATVGLYFCAMAIAGYFVRVSGGAWSKAVQLLFLLGAAIVLMGLFWSDPGRRWLRVLISKNFYRSKYDYRVEWFRFVHALAQIEAEQAHTGVLQAVAQVFGSERALLFMLDESGNRYCAVAAWDKRRSDSPLPPDVAAGAGFLQLLSRGNWIVDIAAYREPPGSPERIAVPEWLLADASLRLIAPIVRTESLLGFIILAPPPPPFDLDFEDRDLLISLARHVATYLAQHAADRKLAESRQFEAYSRLTAFLMHDLKNAVAQLQLVAANAVKFRHNPSFVDDAMTTIDNAANRITALIERLRLGEFDSELKAMRLEEPLGRALARCSDKHPKPQLQAPLAPLVVTAHPEDLVSVFENVIRNAQDATPPTGSVTVGISFDGACATVTVADDGKGMDSTFVRERLFRPFDSTKGASGMGIGAYQVREYIRSLGGFVDVQTSPGAGTRFAITVPAQPGVIDDGG